MPRITKKMKVEKMRAEIIETLKTTDEKMLTRVYEVITGRITEKGEEDGEVKIRLIT